MTAVPSFGETDGTPDQLDSIRLAVFDGEFANSKGGAENGALHGATPSDRLVLVHRRHRIPPEYLAHHLLHSRKCVKILKNMDLIPEKKTTQLLVQKTGTDLR